MGVLFGCESKRCYGSFEGGEDGDRPMSSPQAPSALAFWASLVGGPYFTPDCGKEG